MSNKLGVAQKSSGTMVIGMEESEGLFLEYEEYGVNKFEVLGQIVHLMESVARLMCRMPGALT